MPERGKLDLILHIDDGLLPAHFRYEPLYREEWICVVARPSCFGKSLSLKQYLDAEHVVVGTLPGVQTIPDKQKAAFGKKCRSFLRVPYFGVALRCLPGTELVFDRDVECDHAFGFFPNKKLRENVARFRQINLDNPHEHHDALEFPSGQVVLLTRLCVGQHATVLQLPAGAHPAEGTPHGEIAPDVRRVTFVE